MEQFVQFIGLTTFQRCLFINHSLAQQVHGYFYHSSTGTFTVTSLQEPQFSFLYGKFHILHIAVVVFQFSLKCIQFFVDFRHSFFHRRIFGNAFFFRDTRTFGPALRTNLGNLLRSTDTGNNVFTLSVNQIFAIEQVFTVTGIAREANTCCRSISHITEYHCLNGYSSTPFCRNAFHFAVKNSAFVHPTAEYGTNSTPKLFVSVGREVLTGLFFNGSFKAFYQFFKVFYFQFVIQFHTFGFFYLFDNSFKWIDVVFVYRFHT